MKINPWPKLWKYLYLTLIVKWFQRLCHVPPNLEIFVQLTVQIGDCIRKTLSAHYASGVGEFMQSLPLFVISLMVARTLMPLLQSSFRFVQFLPGLLEKEHLKVSLFSLGEQEMTALRFAWGTSVKRKLCIVPCHICHVSRIWRSK